MLKNEPCFEFGTLNMTDISKQDVKMRKKMFASIVNSKKLDTNFEHKNKKRSISVKLV